MKRIFHFRASSSQLGPLEKRLLEALWERGNATVRDLLNGDGGCQDLAYTTVMTTLDRLFKKGLLARRKVGRAFVYRATASRAEIEGEMGDSFVGIQARMMSQALRKITGSVSKSQTILVSKDINLRIKAAIVGVHAEDYSSDKTIEDADVLYTGAARLAAVEMPASV